MVGRFPKGDEAITYDISPIIPAWLPTDNNYDLLTPELVQKIHFLRDKSSYIENFVTFNYLYILN